jgi:MGT family glycosyltransferase
MFTTFAFGRLVPSPTGLSFALLADAAYRPRIALDYLCARLALRRDYDSSRLPVIDLLNAREPLNLVFTSNAFQPGADEFDSSYRFVGASVGSRPIDASFDAMQLEDPVLYASLGTVFDGRPALLRTFAIALAPLGGTVVVSTGHTEPTDLGHLPSNVMARRFVPQLQVLERAAVFVTHGGMNSANEALFAGVPTLVVPQGADQPLVAQRIVEIGAGLSLHTENVNVDTVHTLARRLLDEPHFRAAAAAQRAAQQDAGGARRAVDELERYLDSAGGGGVPKDQVQGL